MKPTKKHSPSLKERFENLIRLCEEIETFYEEKQLHSTFLEPEIFEARQPDETVASLKIKLAEIKIRCGERLPVLRQFHDRAKKEEMPLSDEPTHSRNNILDTSQYGPDEIARTESLYSYLSHLTFKNFKLQLGASSKWASDDTLKNRIAYNCCVYTLIKKNDDIIKTETEPYHTLERLIAEKSTPQEEKKHCCVM